MRSIESGQRTYRDAAATVTDTNVLPMSALRKKNKGMASIDGRLAGLLLGVGCAADITVFFFAGLTTTVGAMAADTLPRDHFFLVAFISLFSVNILYFGKIYSPWALTGDWRAIAAAPLLLSATVLGVPILSGTMGLPAPDWARLLDWIGIGAAWLVGSRLALVAAAPRMAKASPTRRNVLVVGEDDRARNVLRLFEGQGVHLRLGSLARLHDNLRESPVDEVILALSWADEVRMAEALTVLKEYPVSVHLFPDDPRPLQHGRGVSVLCGVPMVTLSSPPLTASGRLIKAAEDRVLAVVLLILIAPLLALLALAIKIDSPGPVLFRQKRYGFANEVFVVFKFRSMYQHSPEQALEQAKRNDPRITRVGRFLRRTSLDELPQLFNVLNGTMSLVGPRPHAVEHQTYYQHLVDEYRCRHRMKPGITGWAQVNGYRGETGTLDLMRKRVEYDLYYIDNWSLLFDIWILFLTPFACLWGKNAY